MLYQHQFASLDLFFLLFCSLIKMISVMDVGWLLACRVSIKCLWLGVICLGWQTTLPKLSGFYLTGGVFACALASGFSERDVIPSLSWQWPLMDRPSQIIFTSDLISPLWGKIYFTEYTLRYLFSHKHHSIIECQPLITWNHCIM